MKEQLAELGFKGIHTPDSVSIWPLALAWWIVIAVILIAIALGLWLWQKNKPSHPTVAPVINFRKLARAELDNLELQYNQDVDNAKLARQLAALLRRVILQEQAYQSDHHSAAISGEPWLILIDQHFGLNNIFDSEQGRLWLTANYAPKAHFDAQQLIQKCSLALSQPYGGQDA